MADPVNDAGTRRGRTEEHPPGMPRWIKVSLAVVGVLVALLLVLKLTGVGGEHGPARHQADVAASEDQAAPPLFAGTTQ